MKLNENIKRCPNGHYFEINKHPTCPYCKGNKKGPFITSNENDLLTRFEVTKQDKENDDEGKTEILTRT